VVSLGLVLAEGALRYTNHFRHLKNPPEYGYWDPHICDM
jgi:hypothetical protein